MTEKQRNNLEHKNLIPSKKALHKKWRAISQELSDMHLSMADIDIVTSSKPHIAKLLADKHNVTMGEMVLIRQYYKAMEDGDTRAAEFIRDTMGENPKQVVEVQRSTISQMTDEEIQEALARLTEMELTDGGADNE